MAQLEINLEKIVAEYVAELEKGQCVVNNEPEERFKQDDSGKQIPNGYRTELQVMTKGPLYRQTFNLATLNKPAVQLDDKVTIKVEKFGNYQVGRKILPWLRGEITKI